MAGAASRYFQSVPTKSEIIRLDIGIEQLKKLEYLRGNALRANLLSRTKNDEVNADLSYKGNKIPVRIRLKGDRLDHLLGNKWSFRVKVRNKNTFFGMREFSLQHPRTRNYHNEFIFHELLKYENLPYLRYKFVTLKINGKDYGTYALEEHFSKQLIENSGFREGPILKLSEDIFWKEIQRSAKIDGSTYSTIPSKINISKIDLFNSKRTFKIPSQGSQYYLARELLKDFLQKKKNISDVFDINSLATFYAINDLLQAHHAGQPRNIRFYFNPVLARLVPIGYDAMSNIRTINRNLAIDLNGWRLFDDSAFREKYISELERLASEEYLPKFLKIIEKSLNKNLKVINKSYPHVRFLEDELMKNQAYIRARLSPISPIDVYLGESGIENKKISLDLSNSSIFPIKILNIDSRTGNYQPVKEIYLPSANRFRRFSFKNIDFIKQSNKKNEYLETNQVKVEYKIQGSKVVRNIIIDLKPYYPSTSSKNILVTRNENMKEFAFLNIDRSEKMIGVQEGTWLIKSPMILPPDFTLNISGRVKIITQDSGIIISQGPVNIIGKKKLPIVFEGVNGGRGLIVLNAAQESKLNYVSFNSLSSPSEISFGLPGAVTFYNSPVDIKNCSFADSISEDSLNLFRSKFKVSNVLFAQTNSDALDIDFSDGSIINSNFLNIGNDGIDVSGSKVNLQNIYINNAGDKAISIGEQSSLLSKNLKILNSSIGIASKDLSKGEFINTVVENVDLCMVAFQKKTEYGPGYIEVDNKNQENTCNSYLLEVGSGIVLQGRTLAPNTDNATKLLYGNEYGKKTIK